MPMADEVGGGATRLVNAGAAAAPSKDMDRDFE
jgi:hypothetical protein